MAAPVSLAEAANALHDHFGARLDAGHDEGRRLLADDLRKHFGISGRAARKLVEDLEEARTIRYLSDTRPKESPTGIAPSAGLEQRFVVENDTIQIRIGRSSADIQQETTVDVVSTGE